METTVQLTETKRSILSLLLDGETTTEQLALRLHVNPSVIRRHLDDMTANKLVEFSFKRQARGRPSKLFRLGAEGRNEISAKYDVIADLLTVAIAKNEGPEKAKSLFETAAHALASRVGKQATDDSLLRVLNNFGFEAQLRRDGKNQVIRSRNCPIFKLAQSYPELTCDAFHTIFLRDVLDTRRIALKETIARGAKECLHETTTTRR